MLAKLKCKNDFVVRRALKSYLKDSMKKCFPLEYTTNTEEFDKLVHMSGPTLMYGEKTKLPYADYFSVTP